MSKTFKIVGDDISDGYHTFGEIYEHRKLLYIALCLNHRDECVYADHEEWDSLVLVWNSKFGQISYHVSYNLEPLIKGKIKEVKFGDHGWDGHNSNDVLRRLNSICRNSHD